jgi:hypothetical protein
MFGPIRYLSQPVGRGIAAVALFAVATVPLVPSVFAATTLNVSGTASPNPTSPGGTVTYTVNIANPQTYQQVCVHTIIGKPAYCYSEPTGSTATGVVAWNQLGAASTPSVTADSGFSCSVRLVRSGAFGVSSASGYWVQCSNGAIAAGGTGHITITAAIPQGAQCAPNDNALVSTGNNNPLSAAVGGTLIQDAIPGLSGCVNYWIG